MHPRRIDDRPSFTLECGWKETDLWGHESRDLGRILSRGPGSRVAPHRDQHGAQALESRAGTDEDHPAFLRLSVQPRRDRVPARRGCGRVLLLEVLARA